jgi:multicomponent Na+:H+ antiporter subunit E
MSVGDYFGRAFALGVWAFGVWLILTWTATEEQLIFGGCLALVTGLVLAPLGAVATPWSMLAPLRLLAIFRLGGYALWHILIANVGLARRILSPSRPLRTGMVIVPTQARTDGELAATGVITSLIVDNQFVDLDRSEHVLQYHAVAVPEGDPAEVVNAPVERRLARVRRPR